ncbi:PAS domain-containing SpoIIE family protein phosphatase/ATP-binding protein [Streptomyces sp. NBC_00555]|uniref:SpoIIE family protein phosphatase n=1 Tax=Streptomyces sp. NBC_00555 TaxID=2903662 RepID=UPI0022572B23|nr:SpoIIE family protein phosphatase [Streptomyces sp. NBC_00555]MCX5015990.1 PAS domain-containing SpoIIE family protein phosphatase/ATP-binding protein [Streptomyces sp. NBC_00555]
MEQVPTSPGERPEQASASPESAYTATATISEQGIVTEWSEDARRLLGYVPSEVLGLPAAQLLADGAGDTAWRIPSGQERWSGTVALRHRDGRRLELGLLAHRWTSTGGTAKWFVVSAVAGEPRTPRGVSLNEWAFTQSPCFMAIFDADLRLVRANAGMERTLSLTEAEMRGLRLPDIAPDPVSDETERKMRLVLETGEPQYEEAFVRPTGASTEHGWATSLAPLRDRDGRVHAVCLAAHDRTGIEGDRQLMLLPDDAGARIGTTMDSARTAQELADAAVPRFADFALVDLLEPPPRADEPPTGPVAGPVTVSRTAARSVLEGSPESRVAVGETVVYPPLSPPVECLAAGRGAVYGTSDSAVARWVAEDPGAAWIRENGTHSMMVVPLRFGGTTLGLAVFGRHQRREPFQPEDLWLAQELTARAAASIHKARRFNREHTSTMTLQRSLLPQSLPHHAALETASRYLPAGTDAGVGGDWFDVIPLSGARVALVVGDVVGHGIRAAATMGRLRTAVRTLADVDLPPDELLTHLDDLIIHLSADEADRDGAGETAGGIGTTCLYVVYDPVTRHCTVARAGHPPPVVVSPEGSVYLLDVPAGPPLGLGGLPFETIDVELPEGSILALYTDGLLQPRERDIDEALDGMFAALSRPASTLDTVCDRVLTALLTHPPDDDVALLVARTRALHADKVVVWDLPSDPSIVSSARRHTTDQLTAWGLDEAAFVSELVVSELVTNAIRYGQPPIQLRLIHQDRTLICEVSDSSNTAPHMRRARTFDEGGRGLLLVAQLARRWGTRHASIGKTIWAEQSLVGY